MTNILQPWTQEQKEPYQRIYGKSGGNWRYWQEMKAHDRIIMPVGRTERFNAFIAETSPPVQSGEAHLHAFYDIRACRTVWRVGYKGTTICGTPRCRKVTITLDE